MVKKNIGTYIKSLRLDRGDEYLLNNFNNFYEEHGIRMFYMTPYTPQQNRVTERMNKTILDMVRSILKMKNIPKEFRQKPCNAHNM
jgi:IS30 family transposase